MKRRRGEGGRGERGKGRDRGKGERRRGKYRILAVDIGAGFLDVFELGDEGVDVGV